MIEILAIPAWQTGPTSLEAWVEQVRLIADAPVAVDRDGPDGAWIVVASRKFRGFAVLAGPVVEAINFELADPDPAPATRLIEAAAAAIGWEVHPDDGEDDEDDD